MPRCHISLGGNSGQVELTFEQALDRLEQGGDCRVVAISGVHETAPVGDLAGTGFLNAAAELDTPLAPLELLDKLQTVEGELGRTRTTHWGPRTLDLDLLFWDSQVIESPRLVVPHPAAWYRRFVLDPLVEIAPGFVHPVKKVEVCTLRDRLLARPMRVSLAGGTPERQTELIGLLSPAFTAVEFSDWESLKNGNWLRTASEVALIFWLGSQSGLSGSRTSAPAPSDFEHLPPLPRIDVSSATQSVHDFVRYVIQSALG